MAGAGHDHRFGVRHQGKWKGIGLYVNCVGRGKGLYGFADLDSSYIAQYAGDVPIGRDEFIQKIAKGMDLPVALLERLTAPRAPGDTQDGGWRLSRMPRMDEIEEFHLEARFASAGWRTALRSFIED